MALLRKIETGLALSSRKETLKYSVYVGKEDGEYLAGLGYHYYLVEARSTRRNLCTLVPVDESRKNEDNVVKMQFKIGGQVHIEFPVEWTDKAPVGIVGKGCRTEIWAYAGGSLQLKRPRPEAILKAYEHKEFHSSGISQQLSLV